MCPTCQRFISKHPKLANWPTEQNVHCDTAKWNCWQAKINTVACDISERQGFVRIGEEEILTSDEWDKKPWDL